MTLPQIYSYEKGVRVAASFNDLEWYAARLFSTNLKYHPTFNIHLLLWSANV